MMKDVDNYGGVIVLSDAQSNEVLMTDIYTDNTRKQMWMQWVKVAVEKFCLNPKRYCHFVLKDYYTERTEVFRKRSDKQVAFLLHGYKPNECLYVAQAAFVRKMTGELNYSLPSSYINEYVYMHREEWNRYKAGLEQENDVFGMRFLWGNPCHCQRVFELKGGFSFCGKERLRNIEDVAWIFHSLQMEDARQTLLLLKKGEESLTFHLSVGDNRDGLYDLNPILQVVEKFQADGVWLAERTGEQEDDITELGTTVWTKLERILTERFNRGISFHEKTGFYTIYDDISSEPGRIGETTQGKQHEAAALLWKQMTGNRTELLILNTENALVGKVELATDVVGDCGRLVDSIYSAVLLTGGNGVILCTDDNRMGEGTALCLHKLLYKKYGSDVTLMDVVLVGHGKKESLLTDRIIEQQGFGEERPFEKIDIIRTNEGGGMIRVKRGGEYLPAKRLRKSELDNIEKGKLTKEEMAAIYFGEGNN